LLTLQQAADSSKKIYDTYLTRASEVSAAQSLQQVDATVEARAIAEPASPFTSLRFILAMAIFLALVAGLISTLFAEMWNRRIRSWNDVMRETGLPLAGVVPDVAALSRARDAAGHIVSHPLTACAESFRSLRAYLALAAPAGQSKIIAVTSAVPGEGKTMTSVCLARSFAATGSPRCPSRLRPQTGQRIQIFHKAAIRNRRNRQSLDSDRRGAYTRCQEWNLVSVRHFDERHFGRFVQQR
jgi:succinoglycan biosynthesis transport protein ExoP